MSRFTGTISRGIRLPIIKQGDDLCAIVSDTLIQASEEEGFKLQDKDVIAITESVVARSQGNYCTVDDIATDVKQKLGGNDIGIIFPITSRISSNVIFLRLLQIRFFDEFSYLFIVCFAHSP